MDPVQFSHINLIKEVWFYQKNFQNCLRMSEAKYSDLLTLVTSFTEHQDTVVVFDYPMV